jgi:hypothetical protein
MGLVVSLLLALLPFGDDGLEWINAPRLHNPTQTTMLVAAILDQDAEIQATWGGHEGGGHTGPLHVVRGGELCTLTLDGLTPGRLTSATISARKPGATEWELQKELSFRALRARHQPTRFALAADTHAWALFTKDEPGPGFEPYDVFKRALSNMESDAKLDFCVVLTDFAMTQCGSCLPLTTPLGDATAESAETLDEALVRYRMTWGDKMLGSLGSKLPLVTMNGDHEGEAPFWDDGLDDISRIAREATVPPYQQGYIAGPPGTLAFAFEAGPVLLVSLDVHSLTARFPKVPEHWHLGQAQHEWLAEVLGASRRPWKIVMAEHLVGGLTDPTFEAWKGRGTVTATDDGTPEGTFLGEQALVHQTLVAGGADVFVTGHDHVVSWADKDGVAYLIAGRAGGIGHPWADLEWYREAMDFDGDGVPSFEDPERGSREPGHVEVIATDDKLRIDYVLASQSFSLNNKKILSFILEH